MMKKITHSQVLERIKRHETKRFVMPTTVELVHFESPSTMSRRSRILPPMSRLRGSAQSRKSSAQKVGGRVCGRGLSGIL